MPNRPQEKSPESISFIRLCNLYFLKNTLRKISKTVTGRNLWKAYFFFFFFLPSQYLFYFPNA